MVSSPGVGRLGSGSKSMPDWEERGDVECEDKAEERGKG